MLRTYSALPLFLLSAAALDLSRSARPQRNFRAREIHLLPADVAMPATLLGCGNGDTLLQVSGRWRRVDDQRGPKASGQIMGRLDGEIST